MTDETMPSERAREAMMLVDVVSQYFGITFDTPYIATRDSARRALIRLGEMAALTEQPVPAVGWRLVPEEPTKEMLRACEKAMSDKYRPTSTYVSNRKKHRIRWSAMLSAAGNPNE